MIGRITSLMTAQSTLNDLTMSFDRLTATQSELSSGKKIQQPSDDPYGMSLVLQQQNQLGLLTAYQRNVDDGTAWTQTSMTSMGNIGNIVQRVRELVVSASNGTNTQADLNGDAAEVNQLISAVKQEA